MSHEVSETWETPSHRAINVSGHTGRILPPQFGFEDTIYSGVPNAVAAAEARSNLFGQLIQAIQANQHKMQQRFDMPIPFVPKISPEGMAAAEFHALPQPIAPRGIHVDAEQEKMMRMMGF